MKLRLNVMRQRLGYRLLYWLAIYAPRDVRVKLNLQQRFSKPSDVPASELYRESYRLAVAIIEAGS